MLGAADVPGYLLDRKLLSPSAVVAGGLRVVDASRLNRVFVVTAEDERCFVLKGRAGRARPAWPARRRSWSRLRLMAEGSRGPARGSSPRQRRAACSSWSRRRTRGT